MSYTNPVVKRGTLPVKEMLPHVFAFPPNPDSFGGISYLIVSAAGNFMVDVPEYREENLDVIERKGCPEFIFLTHRDDVADAVMFREKFGSKLVIHESERYAVGEPDITFKDSARLGDATIIHTPGHSPGSSSLYYPPQRVIFTGDHITADRGKPVAEDFSWTYDFELQLMSARALLKYDFDYMLAGHGGRWLISNAKYELERFLEGHG